MLLAYVHGICSRKSSFNCFRRTHFLSSTRFLFPSKRRQVRAPSLHLSCLYTTREKSVNSSKPILHPKITILGGGFGGLYTALTLSRYPWTRLTKPKITLVDRSDRFVFLPMLYEVAFGQLDKWQVAPTFSQLLQGTDVEFVLGQVEKVDVQKSTCEIFSTKYGQKEFYHDRLVIAIGTEPSLSSVPGADKYALPFRTLEHAEQLKQKLVNLTKMRRQQNRKPVIFVIGGSYSGVELASNVAEYFRGEARVCIVDRGNRLLDAASEHNRNVALQTLRSLNVESLLDMEVSCVTENAVSLKSIQESTQESEKKFDADLVLWTAGFKPSSWLQFVALEKDPTGRILTSSTLQATRHDNIFVLGDAAAVTDVNGQRCKATAQVAIQQAECAAWNIWASLCNKKPVPFRYEHLGELMTLGKYNGTAEVFGIPLSGTSAQFTRRLAYLFRMPTNLHRLKVGQNWVFKPVSCFFENFSFPL
ncbi:NADH dehydrogenase [Galdieria sulphuraria]|uniref:NADH dehydrogenase n=1 Tax=Galdieria sulphuraria TaxID=130081 RepID=M2XKE3_GALSU|nr:NADH dehydrogenase [Galdieria sulphuraria]EME30607.1 NADH dehydrogenase [Galdieria sulphuraria]|eukprot:XP_005707127.1 NADH dehydrogenase [Galdieria sulphuraria]